MEELTFDYLKRPQAMSHKKASEIILAMEELIDEYKERIRNSNSRIMKNNLWLQIDGFKAKIKHYEQFLKPKKDETNPKAV